uniref:Uncharacterized protein n=1 Tax=Sipha flava TaxID=143950 RepID=A0A2S2QBJ9_9HEMI
MTPNVTIRSGPRLNRPGVWLVAPTRPCPMHVRRFQDQQMSSKTGETRKVHHTYSGGCLCTKVPPEHTRTGQDVCVADAKHESFEPLCRWRRVLVRLTDHKAAVNTSARHIRQHDGRTLADQVSYCASYLTVLLKLKMKL